MAALVPYSSLSGKNSGKEADCKFDSITSQWSMLRGTESSQNKDEFILNLKDLYLDTHVN
jgi:hypothetical protein